MVKKIKETINFYANLYGQGENKLRIMSGTIMVFLLYRYYNIGQMIVWLGTDSAGYTLEDWKAEDDLRFVARRLWPFLLWYLFFPSENQKHGKRAWHRAMLTLNEYSS